MVIDKHVCKEFFYMLETTKLDTNLYIRYITTHFDIFIVTCVSEIAMYSDDSSSIARVFELGHTETRSYKGMFRSNTDGCAHYIVLKIWDFFKNKNWSYFLL